MKSQKPHLLGLLALLFCTLLSVSCRRPHPHNALNSSLDSLTKRVDTNPDSTADVLNAREALFRSADEATAMRFELLRTAALFKAKRTPDDDRPMRAVAAYYERKGTAIQQAWAYYYLGGIYADRGDAPEAINCYHKVLDLEKELYDQSKLMFLTYTRLTAIYSNQYKPQYVITAARRALAYAQQIREAHYIGDCYETLANSYRLNNQPDSAFHYFDKAWQLLRDKAQLHQTSNLLDHYILLCIETDSLDLAQRLMASMPLHPDSLSGFSNVVVGDYFLARKQTEQAEHYFRRATQSHELHHRAYGWQGLLECARLRGDVQAQADYADRYIATHDSVDDRIDEETVSQTYAQFNYDIYRIQQNVLTDQLARSQKFEPLFWMAVAGFLAFGATTTWLVVRHRKTGRALRQSTQSLAEMRAQNEAWAQQAETETQRAAKLQEEIDRLQNHIDEKEGLRHDAQLLSHFHKAATNNTEPTADDWTALIHIVDAQWDNRGTSLVVSPLRLSVKEIRLCMLLYFQFTYKEMQFLLGVSNPSTEKSRLMAKLQAKRPELDEKGQALADAWFQKLTLPQKTIEPEKTPAPDTAGMTGTATETTAAAADIATQPAEKQG